jgi:hypothetical protein
MAKKKIYRTVIQYEILSDEPINDRSLDLDTIQYECTEGHWSGRGLETVIADEELTGKAAVEAIKDQGSDPEFFLMDDEGNDLDEDGTSGQDRESYTDDQDRESYTVSE